MTNRKLNQLLKKTFGGRFKKYRGRKRRYRYLFRRLGILNLIK